MSKQGHKPQRFDKFKQLKDGSGFTIDGSQHVFKYDKYGGWFDQHNNYYDQDGNPQDPPEHSISQDSRSLSNGQADYDQYEKQFGCPKDYDQDEEDIIHTKYLQKIAANLVILHAYPSHQPLRVHFKGMNYFSKREEVYNYFKGKVGGIINLIFYSNQKGQFNGKGYFVVENLLAGEELVNLQGEKFGDREVNFELDDVQEFLLTPIESKELNCDLAKGNKKYIKKDQIKQGSPVKNQQKPPKIQQKKPKVPQKVKVEEKPKVEQKPKVEAKKQKVEQKIQFIVPKKQNLEDFATYTFLKKAFPKKSSFKQWLTQNKITESDYKTVEKIEGNEDYAKISMKKKVYSALNNSLYHGQKIVFKPQ